MVDHADGGRVVEQRRSQTGQHPVADVEPLTGIEQAYPFHRQRPLGAENPYADVGRDHTSPWTYTAEEFESARRRSHKLTRPTSRFRTTRASASGMPGGPASAVVFCLSDSPTRWAGRRIP